MEENVDSPVDTTILWDTIKAVMRGRLIARAAYQKKTRCGEGEGLAEVETILMVGIKENEGGLPDNATWGGQDGLPMKQLYLTTI